MGVKVHVIFCSVCGDVYRLAEAVVAGVEEVAGAEATLFQAAEIAGNVSAESLIEFCATGAATLCRPAIGIFPSCLCS